MDVPLSPGLADTPIAQDNSVVKTMAGTNANIPVVQFKNGVDGQATWVIPLRGYGGGDFDFLVDWYANATTNTARFGVSVCAITPNVDTTSYEAETFGTEVLVDDAVLGTAKIPAQAGVITLSSAAEKNSAADGDILIVKLRRNGAHANDTASVPVNVTMLTLNYA